MRLKPCSDVPSAEAARPPTQRTPDGVSAQVYRLNLGAAVFYLRIAEEPAESLAIDAELLRHLRRLGVRVPEPVYVEPFDPVIGRSILITSEVPGTPLAQIALPTAAASVARAAGHDLAILNQVVVQGFGWIRRDGPDWPLIADLQTYSEFVTCYLPDDWRCVLSPLFSSSDLNAIETTIDIEKRRHLVQAQLAHGDFDATPIFQQDGVYSGLIDFGEIRGAEPLFDLGHFYLHDGETFPIPLFDHLVEGYQEENP